MNYQIRCTLEANAPMGCGGPAWVARDDEGVWRSYCDAGFATNAEAAIRGMFHSVEIISIDGNTAMIDGGDS